MDLSYHGLHLTKKIYQGLVHLSLLHMYIPSLQSNSLRYFIEQIQHIKKKRNSNMDFPQHQTAGIHPDDCWTAKRRGQNLGAIKSPSIADCYTSFPFLGWFTSRSLRNLSRESWPRITLLATGSSSLSVGQGHSEWSLSSRNALLPTAAPHRVRSSGPWAHVGDLEGIPVVGVVGQPLAQSVQVTTASGHHSGQKQGRSRRNPARCNHINLLC